MPVLRIQDLVVPKRPPGISHYSNGTSFTTSDTLWRQPSRRDPRGCPRRFPFYFLFKKRQVEMTTPASRVFPGPWSNPVSSRAKRGIYGAVGPGSLASLGMTRVSLQGRASAPGCLAPRTRIFFEGGGPGILELRGLRCRCHRYLTRPLAVNGCGRGGPSTPAHQNNLGSNPEASALDRPGDGGNVRPCGQAHFAALEIDGNGRRTGPGGGTGDGLDAAVAVHAGDLQDEFLSHVI